MLFTINAADPPDYFPPVATAAASPNGLLAVGGDLSPSRLLAAYHRGIFPWYSEGEPILWWSPDPRTVIPVGGLRVSRRLARRERQKRFSFSVNRDFPAVIRACAEPRPGQQGTWLLPEMQASYIELHRLGHALSIEVWLEGSLVGGVYGVSCFPVFSAESMFSRVPDASKLALVELERHLLAAGYTLIDAQVASAHLQRLGAVNMPRREFLQRLASA